MDGVKYHREEIVQNGSKKNECKQKRGKNNLVKNKAIEYFIYNH